ncbi:Crp/Fnr family transcriptional regulator [Thioalkalivibrio paradoxus]|uniref:Crp/Fnr family transcription regulator n=1 Tax=Thioalkalivibrio paradoxus ARh 1 TaxID=713585 RepID=W0DLX8_9GAMM|nr:cyclic nucleotide-binding domain-containing protein [Thioalkalivibrio paradoxus]AHE97998.1 Crp/Fnr family transcription regulator [Thioalkalivibrio paradoxus ARh 1]
MGDTDNFTSLRSSRLTAGLTDEQVERLAGISLCRRLEDNEKLFQEGETDDTLCVITSGRLAVTRNVGGGGEVTLHVMQAGDLAGEMGFVGGRPHSASLRAMGRPTVCTFTRADFEALVDSDPWLVYRVMKNIVQVGHDILHRMNAQFVEMSNYITHQHGRY